ncbi:hypothetical protein F511_43254 [Dorcoceras hygrometricum]|uniref:Dystroglycan-like n=1 Tax=Dorcoceras hygrometricum TaxID=472368 RepID=A0A2Z7CYB5_9LAMI|nr:hypothetical protein F511_43254 [Dorcoceras hygrometricum]
MASYLFINTLHVCFESVLAMDNAGMVAMFESLVDTGLKGFLGCPAVIHEADLLEFFANGSVRDGLVVSTVNGVTVEFSEQLFAETFELPVEGLTDLSEIPKDLVFDARSIISLSVEPVSMSAKKKEMAIEFRLLFDILAKTISVKAGSFDAITQEKFLIMAAITCGAGSFDAITQEKFLMMAAIICGVRINWNRILFNILKDMVTPGSRQAKGYAIQISLLRCWNPNLELGESSEFPSSKVLTEKTVHCIEDVDKSIDEEMSLEDILMTIPVDFPLSSAYVEITKIILGKTISIPGVNEGDWYKASVPKISAVDKGKAPLLERDPVKGNPIKEQFSLIVADIDFLVQLREKIIDEIPKRVVNSEISRQRSYEDTLPPVSALFKLMRKRWADVCLEPTVFSLRLSQLCTVFVQYSLFCGLSIADISSFVSTIAMDRKVLRNVQIVQNSVSVATNAQLFLDQRPNSSSTSTDSSLNFDDNEML